MLPESSTSASRLFSRWEVVFRRDGVDAPGEVRVEWLSAEGVAPVLARVSFPGSDLGAIEAEGSDPLDAVARALHQGTEVLGRFLEGGGELLQHMDGWGLEPVETDLFEFHRFSLERQLGLPERPYLGEIVSGPTPSEWGHVEFVVRHEGAEVVVAAYVDGLVWREGVDFELGSLGTRLVSRYVEENPGAMREHYLSAAALRRASGNPPYPDPALGDASFVASATRHNALLRLGFREPYSEGTVFVHPDGPVVDDWSNWRTAEDDQRNFVIASAIKWVLANREQAREAGIDPELIEALHT